MVCKLVILNLNSLLSFCVLNFMYQKDKTTTLFPFRPTKSKLVFDDDTETIV